VAAALAAALAVLKEDRSLGVYVRDLQTAWAALSDIHSIVNSHPSQPDRLDAAVKQFAGAMLSFEFVGAPGPCTSKRRFYEHAILDHLTE
jgi:hypothetical protein